jgi:tetratricopeptide (TPR) repeat protein
VAIIFVSYTSQDREWANWIGLELEALGHVPHVHDWEISAGGDIMAWMAQRHNHADHVLCIVSETYLKKPYSGLELHAAQWAAITKRPNFVWPVFIEPCEAPTLLAPLKHCDLSGLGEEDARARLENFVKPAAKPTHAPFPRRSKVAFPSKAALSNIPIRVPRLFMGRDDAFTAIDDALKRSAVRAAITALHGMRGVGKTTLAAAYVERHRGDYRATWWIRAQATSTMRADLVSLGIQLGWVRADDKEEMAFESVMERLRHEGEGILLLFDNAVDADALNDYLPRGGSAKVLVTSNAPNWRGVAEPVEIRVWPERVGADFLTARTGRVSERIAAEALSQRLGGLPLAHEQAAAFCERLGISLSEYHRRFERAPVRVLDDARNAPEAYHNKRTVAKTFSLAIEEATKLNSVAEPLIVHAALLAAEPIPLFLFSEAREEFGEPLATALAGDGLDEAVAALRTFALIDRDTIAYDRDLSITNEAIRIHRLVREIAAARCECEARNGPWGRRSIPPHGKHRAIIMALADVYPEDAHNNPVSWARCALLTPHVLTICEGENASLTCSDLLSRAAVYFRARAVYSEARTLFERALAIRQSVLGPEHSGTALSLSNLADLVRCQGELDAARPLFERALAIYDKVFGPEHSATASPLNNLALLLRDQGDPLAARLLLERAHAILKKVKGPEHSDTLNCLMNIALLFHDERDFASSQPLYERVLAIREQGADHLATAAILHNLAGLHRDRGDIAAALPLQKRALAIKEKVLGLEHDDTASSVSQLAGMLRAQGDVAAALPLEKRALAILEKVLGQEHPRTALSHARLAKTLRSQGELTAAATHGARALSIREKVLGPDHPDTAQSLHNHGLVLKDKGELSAALPLLERSLAITEKSLGQEHPETAKMLSNLALLLMDLGQLAAGRPLLERALAIQEEVLGPEHPDTTGSRNGLIRLLQKQSDHEAARPLKERAWAIRKQIWARKYPVIARWFRSGISQP